MVDTFAGRWLAATALVGLALLAGACKNGGNGDSTQPNGVTSVSPAPTGSTPPPSAAVPSAAPS